MTEHSHIYRLEELTHEQQDTLRNYIAENYRPCPAYKHSTYGLKQHFSSAYFYVTEEVFSQALIKAGYKHQDPADPKSNINVKVLKKLTKSK